MKSKKKSEKDRLTAKKCRLVKKKLEYIKYINELDLDIIQIERRLTEIYQS